MRNIDVMNLAESIQKIKHTISEKKLFVNKKFAYAILVNENTISGIVQNLLTVSAPSDTYKEYEEKRSEIIKKYALVDENGAIQWKDHRFIKINPVYKSDIELAISELDVEYSDVLDARKKDVDDFDELLQSDAVVHSLHKLLLDDIPDIFGEDVEIMSGLLPIING